MYVHVNGCVYMCVMRLSAKTCVSRSYNIRRKIHFTFLRRSLKNMHQFRSRLLLYDTMHLFTAEMQ